ncbi:hypothetical protein MPNT_200013 [Candidatus Methylacidithermus pantelleriae]|uniref:Uncharacterized protein n=1 Tax=Candidatus Methylacidithermus pantelleriae TaxID=2744239 RepID=A0A8J2FSJ4_9BACT|nr:hypothetical protein MPNT_200013 [Candidatus Methylacidithermus pantelleriae]
MFPKCRGADPFSLVTRPLAGGVGIDTNGAHLAVAQRDPFGNRVRIRKIQWNLHGKSGE